MELKTAEKISMVLTCGFFVLMLCIIIPGFMVCQEQVDVQVTVLSKDVMTSDRGIPTYSVTFDTPDGAFVYYAYPNSIDVYNNVNVGDNYTCVYYRYWQNDAGIEHSEIVKIDGVSVE